MYMKLFYQSENDFYATLDAQVTTVQAKVVILRHAPGLTGVVLVVDLAAFILFSQSGFGTFFAFAVKPDDTIGTEVVICMDKYVQAIRAIFQNIVGVSSNDDTGAFLSQLHDGATLDAPQKISGGQPVHHARDTLMRKRIG